MEGERDAQAGRTARDLRDAGGRLDGCRSAPEDESSNITELGQAASEDGQGSSLVLGGPQELDRWLSGAGSGDPALDAMAYGVALDHLVKR